MANPYHVLRVFLSSPSDVAAERQIAGEVIRNISDACRDVLGLALECINWESLTPEMPIGRSTIQELLLNRVKQCHVFVLILNRRAGSKEPGEHLTNTEREVDAAIRLKFSNKSIKILPYFRTIVPNDDRGPQEKGVLAMRRRLESRRLWHRSYDNLEQFKDRFTHDIVETILRFHLSSTKQQILRSFWTLGVAEGDVVPRVAIIYPPIDRSFMQEENPDELWLHRLAPHVVFENFKAIQKVDKVLRLLGLSDFHTYGTTSLPDDIKRRNRVWICLPRNKPAQKHFRRYAKMLRFQHVPVEDNEHRSLRWRSRSNKWLEVHSPLNHYLKEQRHQMAGGPWTAQHLKIVAKDYAILGRFSDRSEQTLPDGGMLKDFLLSGLRGLGTWGAAWFLDRKYSLLNRFEESPDKAIQLLLEVTYVNGQIDTVRDVSDEPAGYFKKQLTTDVIKKTIRDELGSV